MDTLAPGSLLGRLRPANTTAATIFTASHRTEITSILVCNVSGAGASVRIFHDDDGSTYDETTAVYWDVAIPADTTLNFDAERHAGPNIKPGGTLGVRTDTANALNFSVYGVVQSLS